MTRTDGVRQWLTFPGTASAAPLVAALAERYPLVDLSIQEPPIEDLIARLYTSDSLGTRNTERPTPPPYDL